MARGIRRFRRAAGRQPSALQRHDANRRLDGPRGAQQMPDVALGRADRDVRHAVSGPPPDRGRFRRIVEHRAGAVCVEVSDFGGGDSRLAARAGHRRERGIAIGMRLSQMMPVCRRGISGDFGQDRNAPAFRRFECFEGEHGRAFAKRKAVAPRIKGPAARRRQRLQGVEPGENQVTQGIVSTGQHPFGATLPYPLERLAHGVCSGGAGVGNDLGRSLKSEGVHQIEHLPLGLVVDHSRWLATTTGGSFQAHPVKVLPQGHPSAGGAEDDWQVGLSRCP